MTVRAICIVSPDYCDDAAAPASAATRTVELARALGESGVAVHVIAREPGGRRLRTIEHATTVWRFDAPHRPEAGSEPAAWLLVAGELFQELDAKVQFDLLYLPDATESDVPFVLGPHTALAIGPPPGTPGGSIETELAWLHAIERRPRLPARLREPASLRPRLGVVLVSDAADPLARRGPQSLLQHTTVPFRLVVVDTSADAELRDAGDDRVRLLAAPDCRNLAAARNVGIGELVGDEHFVVLLDPDVEVLANWWVPFVAAFDADPDLGAVGEVGARLRLGARGREVLAVVAAGEADTVAGSCVVLRQETLHRVGRFDEELGPVATDDDWCQRAQRIGERVGAVGSGLVLPARSPEPAATLTGLAGAEPRPPRGAARLQDHAFLMRRLQAQRAGAAAPFLLLADAREALSNPALLKSYGAAFTAADDVALVLFGPALEARQFERQLGASALAAGFDLEEGPRLIALLPERAGPGDATALGDEAYARLSDQPPAPSFAHLATIRSGDPAALRGLAARAWRARRVRRPRDPRAASLRAAS